MRVIDIKPGTLVLAKHKGEFVECLVSSNSQGLITLDVEGSGMVVAGGDLNLRWRIQYEKSFAGVGHILKGSRIRLGRKLGRAFVPGLTTLFADGIRFVDGGYVIIGQNLNKGITKELKISEHRKTWVLDNIVK